MWRDIYEQVTSTYYDLFYFMEGQNLLDINNLQHLSVLHHTFAPRIQNTLNIFRNAWNNHKMRTEKHKTPIQQFYLGINLARRDNTAIKNLNINPDTVTERVNQFLREHDMVEPSDIKYPLPKIPLPSLMWS